MKTKALPKRLPLHRRESRANSLPQMRNQLLCSGQ